MQVIGYAVEFNLQCKKQLAREVEKNFLKEYM